MITTSSSSTGLHPSSMPCYPEGTQGLQLLCVLPVVQSLPEKSHFVSRNLPLHVCNDAAAGIGPHLAFSLDAYMSNVDYACFELRLKTMCPGVPAATLRITTYQSVIVVEAAGPAEIGNTARLQNRCFRWISILHLSIQGWPSLREKPI